MTAIRFALAAILAFGVTLAFVGCATTSKLADTYAALSVQERATGVAATDLPMVDRELQMECVASGQSAEQVNACTGPVRAKVSTAAKSITAVHEATITARDMVASAQAAGKVPSTLAPWVSLAVRGYADLTAVLATLGYHLGGQ